MQDQPSSPNATELFARVVRASGLSAIIGPGTVRRALADSGTTPQLAGVDDYRRALPALRARLAAFMSDYEIEDALARINAELGKWRGGFFE